MKVLVDKTASFRNLIQNRCPKIPYRQLQIVEGL